MSAVRGWPGAGCLAAMLVAEQAGVNSETKREAVASGRPRVEACDKMRETRPAETPNGPRPDRTRCEARQHIPVSAVTSLVFGAVMMLAGTAPVAAPRQTSREATRESWQHVPEVFKALAVGEGAAVADVGAGGGFFTVRLAKLVGPTGRVIAVDIDKTVIRDLRQRIETANIKNVEVIQGEAADPKLPEGELDAVLIVNAYHEMREHQAMLEHIKHALRPGGRLVLVEPNHPSEHGKSREELALDHLIDPDSVRRDLKQAGFEVIDFKEQFARQNNLRIEFLMIATVRRDQTRLGVGGAGVGY